MVMGGFRTKTTSHYTAKGEYAGSSNSTMANVFEFNVDESQVAKVQAAMVSGEPVELVYRQWWIRPQTIDHDHVIIDVRPAAQ